MSRKFVDSFGFSWQVWEISLDPASATPDARPRADAGWLYFFSRGTTRRLASFPSDWSTSGWSDLEDLCMRAEVLGAERLTKLVRRLADRERPPVRLQAGAATG